jgi:broad specificity phosphatase PhoE
MACSAKPIIFERYQGKVKRTDTTILNKTIVKSNTDINKTKKMKPNRIILVRHGESEGNIDRSTYAVKPDFKLLLTETGKQQASEAGQQIKELLGDESVMFYVSPMWRTRMTFEFMAAHFGDRQFHWKEDPRLREQEWGHFRDLKANIQIDDERNKFGTFYYRIKDGESCADVYDRVSDFMHSLYRDFTKPRYPENVVLVSHGMTVRLFLMRWFRWTVEEFETLRNPKNGDVIIMDLDKETGRYHITTTLKRKKVPEEDCYPWTLVKPEPPRY